MCAADGAAGAAGRGGIRGVQLAECCKHTVGIYKNGDRNLGGGVLDKLEEQRQKRAKRSRTEEVRSVRVAVG